MHEKVQIQTQSSKGNKQVAEGKHCTNTNVNTNIAQKKYKYKHIEGEWATSRGEILHKYKCKYKYCTTTNVNKNIAQIQM